MSLAFLTLDDLAYLEYTRLLLSSSDNGEYQSLIMGVADDITNKQKLGQLLKESQQEVSPYDYERIRFIFDLIVRLEPDDPIARKGLLILDIL